MVSVLFLHRMIFYAAAAETTEKQTAPPWIPGVCFSVVSELLPMRDFHCVWMKALPYFWSCGGCLYPGYVRRNYFVYLKDILIYSPMPFWKSWAEGDG